MQQLSGSLFEDAERLRAHLSDRGFRPYEDFEIITVTLGDGSLEIDPCGRLDELRPHLESFAAALGYWVFPRDIETGTVSLVRYFSDDPLAPPDPLLGGGSGEEPPGDVN